MQITTTNKENYTKSKSLFERIVMKSLLRLPHGKLHLTLPDKQSLIIGSGIGNIEAEITINNKAFFKKGALYGDIGFAEAYIDGDWETSNLKNVVAYFILNLEYTSYMSGAKIKQLGLNSFRWLNRWYSDRRENTISGSKKNIVEHYDLGNEFYKLWLDKTLSYSSALFTSVDMSLEEAQHQKYERLSKLLKLKQSDSVLEIGSGWGANAIFMAKKFGCHVHTITISDAQYAYVKSKIASEGLEKNIKVQLIDYRKIEGKFDKIVSIEMLEAVGSNYFDVFFEKCNSLLKKNGLMALQVITCPDIRYNELKRNVDFIQKHIFPGSIIPSLQVLQNSINKTSDLNLIDLKEFGNDYAKTLNTWNLNFNKNIIEVKKLGFNDSFVRKWNYYLAYCEAAFEMKNIYVMQLLYARPNNIHQF